MGRGPNQPNTVTLIEISRFEAWRESLPARWYFFTVRARAWWKRARAQIAS
jgi:hypothetical protein